MKRIFYAVLATVSGLVLLFSYRTSLGAQLPPGVGTAPAADAATTPAPSTTAHTPTAHPSSGASASSGASGGLKAGVFTGQAVDTPYGPVQLAVHIAGGKITGVSVLQSPNDNGRSRQIAAYALPTLESETLSAQSSKIDMVSGATYTSDGYQQSLQSALDQAA